MWKSKIINHRKDLMGKKLLLHKINTTYITQILDV